MTFGKLTIALASVLVLGSTSAVQAATLSAPAESGDRAATLIAQEEVAMEDDELMAGDVILVEDDGEDFIDGEAYEVQEDTEGELFVEDESGDTWNIVYVSEDGDEVQLEYDGRVVSGDDVDA